jgi:hypothetical protein
MFFFTYNQTGSKKPSDKMHFWKSERSSVKTQVERFKTLLNEVKIDSTLEFWKDYKQKLASLYNLALRLLSIPATSAHVERFFSSIGITNKGKWNISEELLINRAMLRTNFNFLEEISE